MIPLILILILGASILVFGVRLVHQSRGKKPVTIEDYSAAKAELDTVFVEAAAIRRIFAAEDMEFISKTGPTSVQLLLREERKALALFWLRQTQKQLAHLMDVHLRLASYTYQPSPKLELKLAGRYLSFLVISNFVLLLVWLRGPFETVRIVGYTLRMAGSFCTVFSLRLEDINSVQLASGSEPPVA